MKKITSKSLALVSKLPKSSPPLEEEYPKGEVVNEEGEQLKMVVRSTPSPIKS
jgi:hypothetical protein